MAELGSVYIEKDEQLEELDFNQRGFATSVELGDTIEIPENAIFGQRVIQIPGNPEPTKYNICKEVLYNGKKKADQSMNFAARGEAEDRPKAAELLKGCTKMSHVAPKIRGTKWKCVKLETNPFGTKNATWELA